jgi:hypothetical protein
MSRPHEFATSGAVTCCAKGISEQLSGELFRSTLRIRRLGSLGRPAMCLWWVVPLWAYLPLDPLQVLDDVV